MQVVAHGELWRCAAAQLCHIDVMHIVYNVSALWSIGLVERAPTLGTLYYLTNTALLFLLSPAVRVLDCQMVVWH